MVRKSLVLEGGKGQRQVKTLCRTAIYMVGFIFFPVLEVEDHKSHGGGISRLVREIYPGEGASAADLAVKMEVLLGQKFTVLAIEFGHSPCLPFRTAEQG